MKKRKPAVISCFLAVILALCVSLCFLLIDGVRMAGMKGLYESRARLATNNMLANYQRELYETYGILGMDEEYSKQGTEDGLRERFLSEVGYSEEGVDFLRYQSYDVDSLKYQLLTDGNGAVYRRETALYMVSVLPQEIIDDWMETYGVGDDSKEELGEQIYSDANEALKEAEELIEEENPDQLKDNEITRYKEKKSHPILALVLGEDHFSENCIREEYCPSKRQCRSGTMDIPEIGMKENLLSLLYAKNTFRNYTTGNAEGDGMQYQLEYLVGGKSCDSENLAVVMRKLLLIREGVRFVELSTNPKELEKAEGIAMGLVGFTGNPAIIKAVQMGILLAKAFDKAIKDVRALASGEKLAFTGESGAVSLDYGQYLVLMLLLKDQKKVSMRSLDIVENEMNIKLSQGSFHSDQTVTAMEVKSSADMPWIFLEYMAIPTPGQVAMTVEATISMNYE